MANEEKTAAVKEIADSFTASNAVVLTEYRGLSVAKLTQLRRALGADTTYTVVKNTLTKIAAKDAGLELDDELLTGPTAIAFIRGDAAAAAKGLKEFTKDNPLLVIKGGVLEGKALTADEVRKIADLESREALLAKLAGALKALPTRAAGLFQAPLTQMARLAKALEEKKPAEAAAPEAEAPAEAAAPEAEAPAAQADAAPDAEADAAPAEAAAEETETPAEPAE